ncbi:beta-glucan synthesis-associated protein [Xanthoria parietina]
MSNPIHPPPSRDAPHVRLNSGQENILASPASSNRPLGPSRPQSSRSLVPPRPPTAPPLRTNPSTTRLYSNGFQESAETLLLPPTRNRVRRFRDEDSVPGTPIESQSRRTSFSSDGRESRVYGSNPFDDSRAPSRAGSDDDNVNTQTVSEKYNILPSAGLLLFPEDVEKDDWLHNPDPHEKEKRECDIFTKRGFMNVGGLAMITVGILVLFIGYPILTFVQTYAAPKDPCTTNPDCINVGKVPLLKNIRKGLIDPDTPKSALTKQAPDGKTLKLMFSDEFQTDGRTFYPGDDPYWTAVDLWYGVTQDLEWYDPDAVTTRNGVLELRFDQFVNHGLNYRSGMLQSWNQLCFTGGILEASLSLPGNGETVGFWPGFWSMGNLGRAGYAATTDGMWPYSYNDDKCDAGITANQSQTDGLSYLPGMRLPSCTCSGEDHPSPGKSRSAPEIDVIEASVAPLGPEGTTNMVGVVSQSCQIAPFDIFYQPDTAFMEVYDNSVTHLNSYQGGVFQQALSGLTNVNNAWYDGKGYQKYNFYYTPGKTGNIVWNVADKPVWKLDARALGPNGNVGQRTIPTEPMSIVMNFGMAQGFSNVNFTGLQALMPAKLRFDYVRIYQDPDEKSMTCDPPGYPTTNYIQNHMKAYTNPNYTHWEEALGGAPGGVGYKWPKNTLVDRCKE